MSAEIKDSTVQLVESVRANFRDFMTDQVKLAAGSSDKTAAQSPVAIAWGIVGMCFVTSSLQVQGMGNTLDIMRTMVELTQSFQDNQSDRQNAPTSEAIQ